MTPDDCPFCGHPGYDGHDMRSVPPECMAPGCPCGESPASREQRLDGWLEALLGARLHMFALTNRPDLPRDPAAREAAIIRGTALYKRWSQLYHSEHRTALRAAAIGGL